MKITALRARDVRFLTSRARDGSDALNAPQAGYGLTGEGPRARGDREGDCSDQGRDG